VTVPPRATDEGEIEIVAAPDAAAAPEKRAVSANAEAARRGAGAWCRSEDIPSRWRTVSGERQTWTVDRRRDDPAPLRLSFERGTTTGGPGVVPPAEPRSSWQEPFSS
jgi:hypothetical protein